MVDINLLPWRELEHAYYLKKLKIHSVVGLLLISLLLSILHEVFSYKIATTYASVQLLTDSLQKQKSQLLSSQTHVGDVYSFDEKLINYKNNINKLFAQLQQLAGHAACLTQIEIKNDQITLLGRAPSYVDLLHYTKQLDHASGINTLHLTEVMHVLAANNYAFSLHGLLNAYPMWNARNGLDKDIIEE